MVSLSVPLVQLVMRKQFKKTVTILITLFSEDCLPFIKPNWSGCIRVEITDSTVKRNILIMFLSCVFYQLWKWKWSDIRPSMVTHTWNLCSAFTHPKCTHTAVNTHPEQWAAIIAAAPGEQLGVRCLLKGTSVVVLRVERERCTFTPPTNNSCRPETRTRNLSITSPTL